MTIMMIGNSIQDFYAFKLQFLVVKAYQGYNWRISCIELPSKEKSKKKSALPKENTKKFENHLWLQRIMNK
jgi:hypothetical protein